MQGEQNIELQIIGMHFQFLLNHANNLCGEEDTSMAIILEKWANFPFRCNFKHIQYPYFTCFQTNFFRLQVLDECRISEGISNGNYFYITKIFVCLDRQPIKKQLKSSCIQCQKMISTNKTFVLEPTNQPIPISIKESNFIKRVLTLWESPGLYFIIVAIDKVSPTHFIWAVKVLSIYSFNGEVSPQKLVIGLIGNRRAPVRKIEANPVLALHLELVVLGQLLPRGQEILTTILHIIPSHLLDGESRILLMTRDKRKYFWSCAHPQLYQRQPQQVCHIPQNLQKVFRRWAGILSHINHPMLIPLSQHTLNTLLKHTIIIHYFTQSRVQLYTPAILQQSKIKFQAVICGIVM